MFLLQRPGLWGPYRRGFVAVCAGLSQAGHHQGLSHSILQLVVFCACEFCWQTLVLVFGLLGRLLLPWSESESVFSAACRGTLFFAVGGTTKGLLFLGRRSCCSCSSSSLNDVARFRAAVLCLLCEIVGLRMRGHRAALLGLLRQGCQRESRTGTLFWHLVWGVSLPGCCPMVVEPSLSQEG